MAQLHRVVNLDKKQVLDPKLVGSTRQWEYFAFTDSPVMGGLLALLSNDWSGDRVAIVGNRAQEFDLPMAEEVCGIPASQLCFTTLHGHERFKNVSKKVRKELSENYGYRFQLRNTVTTTVSESGTEEISVSSVHLLESNANIRTDSIEDGAVFTVVNRDKGQILRSSDLSPHPSLRSAIINTWDEDNREHSWLPTALAVLLSTSMQDSRCFVPGYSGTWAGDHVSVVRGQGDDVVGMDDISTTLKYALASTVYIDDRLDPEDESELDEEDELDGWNNED